jgi:soluble lytic murein transglycosylase-like protein
MMVRYEAMRAGLDPHLVLAVIDVESKFRKYAVSQSGRARLMQVMPFWVKEIGEPGTTCSTSAPTCATAARSCALPRPRARQLANALGRYNGSSAGGYPNRCSGSAHRWALGAQGA